MRRPIRMSVVLVAMLFWSVLRANEPGEKARVFCDPNDLEHTCPGRFCRCAPDTLEVTFDSASQSVLALEGFRPGTSISTTIVTEIFSSPVFGWSFGLTHDDEFLTLVSVTVDGTDAEPAKTNGFAVTEMDGIRKCLSAIRNECFLSEPAPGYISGVLLSFGAPIALTPGRHTIARAEYIVKADPGVAGTELRFVADLTKGGAYEIEPLIVINDRGFRPQTVIDGWVKRKDCAGTTKFLRGDLGVHGAHLARAANGVLNISDPIQILSWLFVDDTLRLDCEKAADANDDGRIQLTDAVYLLQYLFSGGPAPLPPFPKPGSDPSEDALRCCTAG